MTCVWSYKIDCPCGFKKEMSAIALIPRVIICPTCGDILYGKRRVSRDGKAELVWFKYTQTDGQ